MPVLNLPTQQLNSLGSHAPMSASSRGIVPRDDMIRAGQNSLVSDKVQNSTEFQIAQFNNAVAREEARINREWNQASAREAMEFNSREAELQYARNQASAREAMEHESNEAQIQRDWIDQQRSTAYQVAVEDLKKAGLNPALAYMNGGASTVAGASAGGFMSTGSSASGVASSGTSSPVDMSSVIDMMQTVSSNSKDVKVSVINGLFDLGESLLRAIGDVAPALLNAKSGKIGF